MGAPSIGLRRPCFLAATVCRHADENETVRSLLAQAHPEQTLRAFVVLKDCLHFVKTCTLLPRLWNSLFFFFMVHGL